MYADSDLQQLAYGPAPVQNQESWLQPQLLSRRCGQSLAQSPCLQPLGHCDRFGQAIGARQSYDLSSVWSENQNANCCTNLFKALSFAKKNFDNLDLEIIYAKVEDLLQNFPQISVDYFAIADENDLKPIKHKKKNQKYRAFIAADISGVRLIDNIKLY